MNQALDASTFSNNIEGARLLILNMADVNETSRKGVTALMTAVRYSSLPMVKYLISSGANVNTVAADNITALAIARALPVSVHRYLHTVTTDKKHKLKKIK